MKVSNLLCASIAALSGAISSSNAVTLDSPGTYTTKPEDRLYLPGNYWIRNNTWGGRQYIDSGAAKQHVTYEQQWSSGAIRWNSWYDWPVFGGNKWVVRGFPAIIRGCSWGITSPFVNTDGLPVSVSDNYIAAKANYSISNPGTQNATYDIWINSSGSANWPEEELMVWMGRFGGAGPIGPKNGDNAWINGASWAVHSNNFTHSYVRLNNEYEWDFNLAEFLKSARHSSRGFLNPAHYVIGIEFGTEVFYTDGPSRFTCNYQVTP